METTQNSKKKKAKARKNQIKPKHLTNQGTQNRVIMIIKKARRAKTVVPQTNIKKKKFCERKASKSKKQVHKAAIQKCSFLLLPPSPRTPNSTFPHYPNPKQKKTKKDRKKYQSNSLPSQNPPTFPPWRMLTQPLAITTPHIGHPYTQTTHQTKYRRQITNKSQIRMKIAQKK